MNTARGLIGVTALLAACGSPDAPAPAVDSSAPPVEAPVSAATYGWIELRDSAEWQFGPLAGTRATLVVRGEVVDQVETSTVQPLSNGAVIYQQVRSLDTDEESCGGPCHDLGAWMMYDGTHRSLDQVLPLFSGVFSSPGVLGDEVYYWGLDGIAGTDSLRITANRFSFADSTHSSVFLYNDVIATDDPGYFGRPRIAGDGVVFPTFNRSFTTDRQLNAVR